MSKSTNAHAKLNTLSRTTANLNLLLITTLALTLGCSSVDDRNDASGKDIKVRSEQEVLDEVGSLSSEIWKLTGIKGKASEPGPYARPCDDNYESKDVQWVRHPWSLSKLDNTELGKGMKNLHQKLPDNGWELEKYGKDSSRNRNLELQAVHKKTRTQLEVRWLKGLDGHTPLLEITLYSQCFKKPQESDPEDS